MVTVSLRLADARRSEISARMPEDGPLASPFPPEHLLNAQWMAQVKDGNTDAFRLLIETHQQRVIGTVTRMLGDSVDADDIAQQVFIRVWNSAARYEPKAKFTTWLFKITRNLVFNELRRRRRHPTSSLDAEMSGRVMEVATPRTSSPDALLLDAELQRAIQAAIEALPEAQRLAIVLRRYEALPYDEIAEILELSIPAVKSLLFRARTELRDRLRRYLEE